MEHSKGEEEAMNSRLEYLLGKYRCRALTPEDEVELREIIVAEAPEFKDSPICDVVAYGLVAVGMKVLFSLFEDRVAELPRAPEPEPDARKTVFVVEKGDCESSWIISIHATRETAFKVWNDQRLLMLDEFRGMLELCRQTERDSSATMYERMIENLEETDPEKIDNYPHDCVHLTEHELED